MGIVLAKDLKNGVNREQVHVWIAIVALEAQNTQTADNSVCVDQQINQLDEGCTDHQKFPLNIPRPL